MLEQEGLFGMAVAPAKAKKKPVHFDGPDYDPKHDLVRLSGQIQRIYDLMKDARFRTLSEIATATGDHEASVSAQLRHLRKPRFGGHTVNKQRRGALSSGLWEYQLIVNKEETDEKNGKKDR